MQKPTVSYTLEDQKRMTQAKNYFAWQSRMVLGELEGRRRIVEIGCGLGNFTSMLLDRELVIALDIERECIERLLQRYPDRANLHALVADVNSVDFRAIASYQPDACVCLNVLEHVEDDLEGIRAMRSVLTAGGLIVLIVPAFETLYGPIDRNLGHWRRYRRASLTVLAARAGFRVRKIRYMNAVGMLGWWVNARILKREAQSEAQIKVFDRYVVPVMAALESVIGPPFGQSLFVALEKV